MGNPTETTRLVQGSNKPRPCQDMQRSNGFRSCQTPSTRALSLPSALDPNLLICYPPPPFLSWSLAGRLYKTNLNNSSTASCQCLCGLRPYSLKSTQFMHHVENVLRHVMLHMTVLRKSVQLMDLVMTRYERDRALTQHLTIRKADSQETQWCFKPVFRTLKGKPTTNKQTRDPSPKQQPPLSTSHCSRGFC